MKNDQGAAAFSRLLVIIDNLSATKEGGKKNDFFHEARLPRRRVLLACGGNWRESKKKSSGKRLSFGICCW